MGWPNSAPSGGGAMTPTANLCELQVPGGIQSKGLNARATPAAGELKKKSISECGRAPAEIRRREDSSRQDLRPVHILSALLKSVPPEADWIRLGGISGIALWGGGGGRPGL